MVSNNNIQQLIFEVLENLQKILFWIRALYFLMIMMLLACLIS